MIYTDDAYANMTLKKRAFDAHKGDFGKVLIFAGSTGMAGAAVLCGRAALKTGSGLVRFLLPEMPCPIYPVLQTSVPEATCISFSHDINLQEYDAIACGSGIGQSETSLKILEFLLHSYGKGESGTMTVAPGRADRAGKYRRSGAKTLLLDADALNLISRHPSLAEAAANSPAALIITPHVGEAKRLLGSCAGIASLSDRKGAVSDLAAKYRCIAVLKGAGTLVAAEGSPEIYENTTGNPGMATGGSGDSLSGIITSLAGQKYTPLDATRLGVFIHGKAGDIAAEQLGEMSVTAGDICNCIPSALKIYY